MSLAWRRGWLCGFNRHSVDKGRGQINGAAQRFERSVERLLHKQGERGLLGQPLYYLGIQRLDFLRQPLLQLGIPGAQGRHEWSGGSRVRIKNLRLLKEIIIV